MNKFNYNNGKASSKEQTDAVANNNDAKISKEEVLAKSLNSKGNGVVKYVNGVPVLPSGMDRFANSIVGKYLGPGFALICSLVIINEIFGFLRLGGRTPLYALNQILFNRK